MSAIIMQETKKVFAKAGKGTEIKMSKTMVLISRMVPHKLWSTPPRTIPRIRLLVEIILKPPPADAAVSSMAFFVSAEI